MRLDIRRTGYITKGGKDGQPVGASTRVKIVKNKLAPPHRVAEFDMMFGKGISKLGEVVDLGVSYGFLNKSGAWYSIAGESTNFAQGRDNAVQYFEQNPAAAEELETKIREAFKTRKDVTTPGVSIATGESDEEEAPAFVPEPDTLTPEDASPRA